MLRGAAAAKASHGIATATNAQGPHSKEAGQAKARARQLPAGSVVGGCGWGLTPRIMLLFVTASFPPDGSHSASSH